MLLVGGLIAGAALVLVGCLALLLISGLVGGLALLLIAGGLTLGLVAILLEVGAHLSVDSGALLGVHGLADLLVARGALVLVCCLVDRLVNSSAFWGVTSMDTWVGQGETEDGKLESEKSLKYSNKIKFFLPI